MTGERNPITPDSTVPIDLILRVIVAAFTYGIPALSALVSQWRGEHDRDPTAAEVHALLDGLKPPDEY